MKILLRKRALLLCLLVPLCGAITDAPTESPAPSPSPSSAPTEPPTRTSKPTVEPTGNPTESPAPSPAPSSSPTEHPTSKPSASPTNSPTITPMPTLAPTVSMAPTNVPTMEPTRLPTNSPTTSPPTTSPSVMPTNAPTTRGFKTKTGITNVLLVNIEKEMGDQTLGKFEIETLEFIRDTLPSTPDYELDVLAVTVLTQDIVHAEASVDGERRLAESDTLALQVAFRTVGVVTKGRAPRNLNFTDITDEGFKHYFDEYIYRLSNIDPFFESLKVPKDMKSEKRKGGKGRFVVSLMFSFLAFLVAIYASYYAIRNHLKNQNRIAIKSHLSAYPGGEEKYINNGTQSFSSDEMDTKNSDKDALRLEIISQNKEDLQDIGLSPSAMASPFNGITKQAETSMSMKSITSKRSSYGGLNSSGIRKWLTPRISVFGDSAQSDPSGFNFGGRKSLEPDALKASTSSANGVFSSEKNTIDTFSKSKRKSSNGPVTIPVSYFSQGSDGVSEASGMGSLADSTVSSFFQKMGKSVFSGNVNGSEAGGFDSTVGGSGTLKKPRSPFNQKPNKEVKGAQYNINKQKELNEENLAKTRQQPYKARRKSDSSRQSSLGRPTTKGRYDVEDSNETRSRRSRTSGESEQSEYSLNSMGRKTMDRATLGARDIHYGRPTNRSQAFNSRSQPGQNVMLGARDASKLEGTYDVFAPSGPIGIVVDTSKHGPAVHSLKSTSPLLGLISPGDVIIALDDEDTRNMTAAALTRLMAKKSRQQERKISLMAINGV